MAKKFDGVTGAVKRRFSMTPAAAEPHGKLLIVRTKSDTHTNRLVISEDLEGEESEVKVVVESTVSKSAEGPANLLKVPAPKRERARSWDPAWLNTRQISNFFSPAKTGHRSRIEALDIYCVHCKCQEEYERLISSGEHRPLVTAPKEPTVVEPTVKFASHQRPEIVVSPYCSPSQSESDVEKSSSQSCNKSSCSSGRGSSVSDNSDGEVLPAITLPIVPSISVTQFAERPGCSHHQANYFPFPPHNYGGGNFAGERVLSPTSELALTSVIDRYHRASIQSNATERTITAAFDATPETLSPPPSPRAQLDSFSSGHVGCGAATFFCFNNFPPNRRHVANTKSGRWECGPIACGGVKSASIIGSVSNSSAYRPALAEFLEIPRQQRSSSIDVSSLSHDIERLSTDSDEDNRSRSKSLDMSTRLEVTPSTPSSRITALIKRAVSKSPGSLRRATVPLGILSSTLNRKMGKFWTESALPNEHIWTESGAQSDCYLKEADCLKTGEKVKCAACHIAVHESCLIVLNKTTIKCKPTFRKVANPIEADLYPPVHHHWVHTKRQTGRCKRCGKPFQQKFFNKELVAICCAWCKVAYHNKHGCFTMTQIEEICSFGALQNLIIRPSWVLKFPTRQSSQRKSVPNDRDGFNRRKRRSRKKERIFVVKPAPTTPDDLMDSPSCPLLIFVNPKSGGNKGVKILTSLCWLVNPRQVFDITIQGPRFGLEMFRKVPNLRVLVCGGDGTVGWILSALDSLKWPSYPPIALVPLGTGNDLANTLGWGRSYNDEPLESLLLSVCEESSVILLDRWLLDISPNKDAQWDDSEDGVSSCLPSSVMNNYFSIGADAQVALKFHESRTANPEMFSSRFKNRMYYGSIGTKDVFKRSWKDLSDFVSLECDGVNLSAKIQDLKPHCLLFLNIQRYGGGTLPWGSPYQTSPTGWNLFGSPSPSDGKIEVIGFTSATLAALQVEAAFQVERHGEPLGQRLAQCSTVRIITRKAIPVQVDGEPCRLAPSKITIRFHSKVPLLKRNVRKQSSRTSSLQPSEQETIVTVPSPVNSSVSLKIPVVQVAREDYEENRYEVDILRRKTQHVGEIHVESELDLDEVRKTVDKIVYRWKPEANWCFLDYISSNRVFRIDKAEETLHSLSDICRIEEVLLILDHSLQPFDSRKPVRSVSNLAEVDDNISRNSTREGSIV